jgi:DNA replication initiation complex subunit (GINS family)
LLFTNYGVVASSLVNSMDEIRITLETLYDILRNEKKREELQQLEASFFQDVVNYLKEKQALLNNKQVEDELFAVGEQRKIEYELRSIKRILKEIYEKREKKIIDIALNRSRTGSDIIDTSSMLAEEKMFYQQVLGILDVYRRGVLLKLFQGRMPVLLPEPATPEIKKEIPAVPTVTPPEEPEEEESEDDFQSDNQEITKTEVTANEKNKIKFVRPVPSFVWKDLKVYGPYDKGEEIEIFAEVADLLIRKGRAEKV